jgi:hypothetical protein
MPDEKKKSENKAPRTQRQYATTTDKPHQQKEKASTELVAGGRRRCTPITQHLIDGSLPRPRKARRELAHFTVFWRPPTPHLRLCRHCIGMFLNQASVSRLALPSLCRLSSSVTTKIYHPKRNEKLEHSLILNLHQHQPCEIPAPIAPRIIQHQPLRLIKTLTRERIIACQATQLVEQVVGIDIIPPCGGHRGLEARGVIFGGGGGGALDAPELRHRVDAVSA